MNSQTLTVVRDDRQVTLTADEISTIASQSYGYGGPVTTAAWEIIINYLNDMTDEIFPLYRVMESFDSVYQGDYDLIDYMLHDEINPNELTENELIQLLMDNDYTSFIGVTDDHEIVFTL